MEARTVAQKLFDIVKESGYAHFPEIEAMVNREFDHHEFVRAYTTNVMNPTFDDVCKMTIRFAEVFAGLGISGMSHPKNLARMFKLVLGTLCECGHKHENIYSGFLTSQWNRIASMKMGQTMEESYPELWQKLKDAESATA